jgi:ATP synthase protein I
MTNRETGDPDRRARAPSEHAPPPPPASNASAMAIGLRLSSELVAGVIVGGAIGWALDYWLGIKPWGLIVFLLLGFTAGVLNVMRTAGVMSKPGERR